MSAHVDIDEPPQWHPYSPVPASQNGPLSNDQRQEKDQHPLRPRRDDAISGGGCEKRVDVPLEPTDVDEAVTPRQMQPPLDMDDSCGGSLHAGPSTPAHVRLLESCVGSFTLQNARPYQVMIGQSGSGDTNPHSLHRAGVDICSLFRRTERLSW